MGGSCAAVQAGPDGAHAPRSRRAISSARAARISAAARSYFDELIACRVKVYEYHASMLHSKTMLVDDMVGSEAGAA